MGVLLHIGYHKTGTTWLQQLLFPNETAGFFPSRQPITELLVHVDPLAFDADEARRPFEDELEQARANGRTLVISHERMSGYPAAGGYDRKEIAERLAATFPGARVLIGIREQVSVLGSMYPQYVEDGGHLSLSRFLHPPSAKSGLPAFRPEYYEYDRLIDGYRRLFGADNVLVLPFEMLRRSPQAYLDRVTDFCGAPRVAFESRRVVNPSRNPVYIEVKRFVNLCCTRSALSDFAWFDVPFARTSFLVVAPLFDFLFRPLDGFFRRLMAAKIVRAVGGRYGPSNARTAALIGIDLAALGYDCAPVYTRPKHEATRAARVPPDVRLAAFILRHPRLKSVLEWWLGGQRQQR